MALVGVPDADMPLRGVEVLAGGFDSFKNASLLGDVALYVGEDEDLRSMGLEYKGSLLFNVSKPGT